MYINDKIMNIMGVKKFVKAAHTKNICSATSVNEDGMVLSKIW